MDTDLLEYMNKENISYIFDIKFNKEFIVAIV